MTRGGALLLIAAALLPAASARAQDPSCWSFRLPGVAFGVRPFPSLLLSDSGRVVLHDGAEQATWDARGDTLRVASTAAGFQSWTLTIPAGRDTATAILRRWEDNPHTGAERVVTLRVEQTTGRPDLDQQARAIARVARMTPATRGGAPIAAWVGLWFRFR